jgi:putative Mg2+ transporter-C (MgtC) family protein
MSDAGMPLHLGWSAIALRLALTAFAGAAIGINRSEQDRPAGLRTTMLVALAAAIAMIQANLLLPTVGKPLLGSFVVLDLMRLPLGILSGIGFIGAGAIVRRGDLVQGVTTAATLWYVTVMGLCFGGGQLGLGLAALALALFVLWCLKWLERRLDREHRAELSITFDRGTAIEETILSRLAGAGLVVRQRSLSEHGGTRAVCLEIRWQAPPRSPPPIELVRELGSQPGIVEFEWQRVGGP